MKRLLAILTLFAVAFTATAQIENSIVLDRSTFRAVQTEALTGVNIDPIGLDLSRRPCARLKIFFHRMTREQMELLEPIFPSGTINYTKCKVAEGNTVLILEFTAKPRVKFYLRHSTFGTSNEVEFDFEGNKEYQLEASLNQTYSIVVNSNVAGADVYLDGVFKGETDNNNRCIISDVIIGTHNLKIILGNDSAEQRIIVHNKSIVFKQDIEQAVIPISARDLQLSSEKSDWKENKAIFILPKSNYLLLSEQQVMSKNTIINRDFDKDGVEEEIIIGRDHPNGIKILGIQNNKAYDLRPSLPYESSDSNQCIDEFGFLLEGFFVQISCIDLDNDNKEELVISVGNMLSTSQTIIYRVQKSDTSPFVKVWQIEGQDILYLTDEKEIIVPIGSQGLYDGYKMQNGKIIITNKG